MVNTRCLDRSDNFRPALSGPNGKYFGMSRPGRTALWRNLLRDNQKPVSALDAVISAHPPNGANGTYLSATRPSRSSRCPELASSYCLCHYRPTSACFCHRLYTSARRSAAPARLQKKRDFPKSRFFIIRFGPSSAPPRLSARQSRKPSRTSCSRILAQSATGCFSPSTNRSGHPRLQSSM